MLFRGHNRANIFCEIPVLRLHNNLISQKERSKTVRKGNILSREYLSNASRRVIANWTAFHKHSTSL